MNVLIVLPTAVIGGAERVMFNLADSLLLNGSNVTVYVMSRGLQEGWGPLLEYEGFRLITRNYKSEKASLPRVVADVFRLCRRNDFGLIVSSHTHVNAMLSFFRKVGILKTTKLVSRESTFIFERFFGVKRVLFFILYKLFYGNQDLLVFQTKGMMESLRLALGKLPVRNSVVLSNPVALRYVDRMLSADERIHYDTATIVACGRLVVIKNFDALIRAVSLLRERGHNCRLIILGDGPQRSALQSLIDSLELTSSVLLKGRVENPFRYFTEADIGIVSSLKEGFPNVLIEMMASRIRCLVSTPCTDGVADLPELTVTHGFDEVAIAEALSSCLISELDCSEVYRQYIENNRSIELFARAITNE